MKHAKFDVSKTDDIVVEHRCQLSAEDAELSIENMQAPMPIEDGRAAAEEPTAAVAPAPKNRARRAPKALTDMSPSSREKAQQDADKATAKLAKGQAETKAKALVMKIRAQISAARKKIPTLVEKGYPSETGAHFEFIFKTVSAVVACWSKCFFLK